MNNPAETAKQLWQESYDWLASIRCPDPILHARDLAGIIVRRTLEQLVKADSEITFDTISGSIDEWSNIEVELKRLDIDELKPNT